MQACTQGPKAVSKTTQFFVQENIIPLKIGRKEPTENPVYDGVMYQLESQGENRTLGGLRWVFVVHLFFCGCYSWIIIIYTYVHIFIILFYDTSYLHILRDWLNSIYGMHASGTLSTDAKMWRLFWCCDCGFRRYPKAFLLLAIWALKVFVTLAAWICVIFWHPADKRTQLLDG